jgi:hypothetical protein
MKTAVLHRMHQTVIGHAGVISVTEAVVEQAEAGMRRMMLEDMLATVAEEYRLLVETETLPYFGASHEDFGVQIVALCVLQYVCPSYHFPLVNKGCG